MMKLFDLHGDTGYAVMKLRAQGKQNIMNDFQLKKRTQGGFQWLCSASYFEGSETWEDMQTMILALREEIALCSDVKQVHQAVDLEPSAQMQMILSVEGMCGIREDAEAKIDWLYEHDIKLASLVWNEQNALANGVKGDFNSGLTDMGKCVVKRMSENGMIIDVSHANEKTFWDIMKYAQTPIIASHSNVRTLCDHPRNLYDEQLRAIADRGGLVGVVCAGAFVHPKRDKQTVSHLVKHIQYIKQLIGIDHIALGCDFMDDYDNAQDTMLTDLNSPKDAQRIITEMRKQGFHETEIKQIAYKNAYEFFQRHLD